MLSIRQACDLDTLADDFFALYQQHCQAVFSHTPVIVPNLAVADWLEQRLAAQCGIVARMHYSLWREFVHQAQESLYRRHHPQASLPLPLSSGSMRWLLFAYLLNAAPHIWMDAAHPLHQPLQTLFNGLSLQKELSETQVQRLWAYAEETAKIFNDYLAMRPEWLADFAREQALNVEDIADAQTLAEMPDWLKSHYQQVLNAQAFIWKTLFADQAQAQARIADEFLDAARRNQVPADILAERIFVFMPNDVDQSMLDVLQALGEAREVFVFLYGVSNQRLSDIVDSRWLRRLSAHSQEEQHLSSGHDFFSRFGKQERQRFKLLEANELAEQIDYLQSPEPQSAHLLGQLQDDIRRLDDAVSLNPNPLPEDDSLKIHGCHGLLRQLEVLRGEIVRWLNADSSRQLDDIVILLPDVAAYQDALRAVFPQQGNYDGYTLPTRLTGISTVAVDNLWQALGGIYALADSDFSFPAVKQWLLLPDNCAAYGLSHEDMLYWLDKLAQAGFRRGFDEAHLQESLNDGDYRFSFCYALDRLVAGYAMPTLLLYADRVAPYTALNSHAFAALSALCRFAEEIASIRAQRGERMEATAGLERLRDRLHTGYAHALDSAAYQAIDKHIRNVIYQLVGSNLALQKLPHLPFKFIVRTVAESLGGMQVSAEPSGVITIARLNTLQALPYRLIVFLGAENGAFPAQPQDRRYNLLDIAPPQLGDRSRRNEDLAAFLHCLCAAKEACWLFYTAVDPNDGEARIPPAPIQELLQYLSENQVPQAHVHIVHSADPFHPEQEGSTHAAPLWQKLRRIFADNPHQEAQSWLDWSRYDFSRLPSVADSEKGARHSVEFRRIVQALRKPLNHYLREQSISLPAAQSQDLGREPLFLNHLEQWQLRNLLIQSEDNQEHRDIIAALPVLPVGRLGEAEYAEMQAEIAQRKAALYAAAGTSTDNPIRTQECLCAGTCITAALPVHADKAWLRLSAGKSKEKYWLEAWLWHLLWQSCDDVPSAQKGASYVNFSDEKKVEGVTLSFAAMPQAQAEAALAQWLKVYHSMSEQPWLWSAEAFFARMNKGTLGEAQKALAEAESAAYGFLFRDADQEALSQALEHSWETAQSLYQDLYAALQTQIMAADK